MVSEWIDTKLGDVLTLKRGYDLPAQDRQPGPFPVVSSSGVTGSHVAAKAVGPGVVTGRYGTLGETHFITQDYWPLNTTLYVKDFKGNDPRFINYFLKGLNFASYNDKSSVPGLNRNHLHSEVVHFPIDLAEQRGISGILGTLDDKIELNRQMNRTLEATARTIFKSWFLDFEPVKAKAAGATSFRGMPQAIFDQLPDRFTGTELGQIPDAWEYVPIGELVDVIGGGTPSTKIPEFWEGGEYAFCTPKDLSKLSAPVLLDTERHVTEAGVEKISSRQLPVGTVILSSRAPIGYLALAGMPVSVNQGIIAMVCGKVPNSYVMLWTEENMDVIKSRAGGTTFAEISKKNFRPIPALRPDDVTLSGFGDVTRCLFDRIASNERESRTLTAVRDTLLPKLISGELRVPAAAGGTNEG